MTAIAPKASVGSTARIHPTALEDLDRARWALTQAQTRAEADAAEELVRAAARAILGDLREIEIREAADALDWAGCFEAATALRAHRDPARAAAAVRAAGAGNSFVGEALGKLDALAARPLAAPRAGGHPERLLREVAARVLLVATPTDLPPVWRALREVRLALSAAAKDEHREALLELAAWAVVALCDHDDQAGGGPAAADAPALDLAAIRERAATFPGTWRGDAHGAPTVRVGFAEAIINKLVIAGPLTVRRRKGRTEDEALAEVVELLKPILAPAYAAQADRVALLEALVARMVNGDGRVVSAGGALAVVDRYLSCYPTDVFPDGGETVDAKSAAFARRLLTGLRADLITALRDATPAEACNGRGRP